ncbi:MAG TPA: hypothetical protein VMM18_13455 [Gemmatimonadaceae bacterium]|nr:hypothetical protein [Gemmatimonadaceae bacterium]
MSTVRVYIDGRGVDAPAGGTVLDAVRVSDPAAAEEVSAGRRALTDSRGIPAPADAQVYDGAIFRLVAVRERAGDRASGR